ncbi:response regulator transcription factor [Listeria monocytogenes]|uniref:response regulator transcription factor n=1 Tax=Listeria seeligeri TaxID=1640 RepID=UPI0022EB992B|nr:response regulator transcription factor [Listeria seeligeri]EKT6042391.1 response regulator transcription factor [Listeria monocytogenes]EKT6045400.1 response regulator transcription factor [Listeria monocytogenes]
MEKILVAEDDTVILAVITAFLTKAGYQVIIAKNGIEAYHFFQTESLDLIIMDIMMPSMDGYTLTELIRSTSSAPILMMTALSEEEDELKGFDLGADDYIQKPFSYLVLLKRVQVLLRRSAQNIPENKELCCGNISVNIETFEVISSGELVVLTKKEFDILALLIRNKKKVITREVILSQAWDFAAIVDTSIINTHMKNLRKKLHTKKIKTIRGAGYKMDE